MQYADPGIQAKYLPIF